MAQSPFASIIKERSNSWLFHYSYFAAGVTSEVAWHLMSIAILAFVAAGFIFSVIVLPCSGQKRIYTAMVLSSGIPSVIAFSYGFYDALYFLGLFLIYCRPSSFGFSIIGSLVMAGSNPEQSLLAGIGACLVGISLDKEGIVLRRMSVIMIVTSLLTLFVLLVLRDGQSGSRASAFIPTIIPSLAGHLAGNSVELFSWYGLAWLSVLIVGFQFSSPIKRICFWCGMLLLPAAVTLLTLDGTRVFVLVSAPAALYFFGTKDVHQKIADWLFLSTSPGRLFTLLALLNPCLYYRGDSVSLWLPNQLIRRMAEGIYESLN